MDTIISATLIDIGTILIVTGSLLVLAGFVLSLRRSKEHL